MKRIRNITLAGLAIVSLIATGSPGQTAKEILDATGVKGGVIVHIGCGGGELTAALRANDSYIVHGLAAAGGKLYMTTIDGKVVCLDAK